jgi:amino acid adenylation domain-containing protein
MFYKEVLKPILKSVEKYGSSNAFCINDRFFTYTELAESISKIREALQKEKILNKNIGLVANDDIETYASILAVWFEGLAYVPLHPNQPFERNMGIIKQADVDIILDSSYYSRFSSLKIIGTLELQFKTFNLIPQRIPDAALAYILYTSGSTGNPKGVMITRGNLGAFMAAFWKTGIQVHENDKCLQCFDLSFDVSVQSFLVPLTRGACNFTIPHNQIKYSYVYGLLEDHQITFGAMTPSMIRYLRPYFDEILVPSMRCNIITAEASPVELIDKWAACVPNADIYDFYGPTETTIYCTYHKFNRSGSNKQVNGMMSIGKPMEGLNAIIINEELKILNPGHKGELCIGGKQVTPGYWKEQERNKKVFFETQIDGISIRFYKTGDLCYFDEDYDIMLIGRMDDQVKVQGYRIELAEIEYHARECLRDQNVVALTFTNQTGNNEIALFVEGSLNDIEDLKKCLKSKLPFYMIPLKIIVEKAFPINTSGKIDRVKLKKKLIIE